MPSGLSLIPIGIFSIFKSKMYFRFIYFYHECLNFVINLNFYFFVIIINFFIIIIF